MFSFCLDDLSIGKSVVLKFLTINVRSLMCDLSISNLSFTNMIALALGVQMLRWNFFLVDFPLMSKKFPFPSLLINFGLKSILLGYISLLLRPICLENLFLTLYCEIMSVFDVEVCFLYAAEGWILVLCLLCQPISFYCLFLHFFKRFFFSFPL